MASWSPALVALQCGRLRSMMVPLCMTKNEHFVVSRGGFGRAFLRRSEISENFSRKILRGAEGAQIAK
jgi:hypothetical protein